VDSFLLSAFVRYSFFPPDQNRMSASVAALRALIQQRFPDAAPLTDGAQTSDGVATGITALDRLLPNQGLPRGRLSVWTPLGAANAILRSACRRRGR
jgi:hypothetical protein